MTSFSGCKDAAARLAHHRTCAARCLSAAMSTGIGELILRFPIGGAIVSFFAVLAEIFRPKSFAGLFGAAPSVALATLSITIAQHGRIYVSEEARTMIFVSHCRSFCYASAVSWVLMRIRTSALTAAVALMPIWFAVSFTICFFISGSGPQ